MLATSYKDDAGVVPAIEKSDSAPAGWKIFDLETEKESVLGYRAKRIFFPK